MASWWLVERFSASALSGQAFSDLRVQAREGGTITEVAGDGSEHLWELGRVPARGSEGGHAGEGEERAAASGREWSRRFYMLILPEYGPVLNVMQRRLCSQPAADDES